MLRKLTVTRRGNCGAITLLRILIAKEMIMNLGSHLQELKRKHLTLSEQVETAQRSPASDDLQIADMKKKKLRLKEEIERIEHA
jgi:hypothetical protein